MPGATPDDHCGSESSTGPPGTRVPETSFSGPYSGNRLKWRWALSRLAEFLAYHNESARAGDIDPSHAMLKYLCSRFELNTEQRYWLAFLYGLTYCGASVYYAYSEFPDYENVNVGRMNRWWAERGREAIICQTDRRWVRSSNQFVPAVESYTRWLGGKTQEEHFAQFNQATPEARYDALLRSSSALYSFGQFALFLLLEAIDTITPLNLVPTDLDLNRAWSCRNGLVYAYGMDQYLTPREAGTPAEGRGPIAAAWADLRSRVSENVWNLETTLCAYRKYRDGKRYLGSYLDRQALEIAKMASHDTPGVAWEVLWQYRWETYDHGYLAELHSGIRRESLTSAWKEGRLKHTAEVLSR